jgi:hypothetical protein
VDIKQKVAAARAAAEATLAEHDGAGVALICDGKAYGWKNYLRDPQHEIPGVLAVSGDGRVYEARGGNEQDGAAEWVEVHA